MEMRGDERRWNKSEESEVEVGVKDSWIWVRRGGGGGAKVKTQRIWMSAL